MGPRGRPRRALTTQIALHVGRAACYAAATALPPGRDVAHTRGKWREGIQDDPSIRHLRGTGYALLLLGSLAHVPAALAQTITRGPLIQNPDALTTTMTILWWTNVAGNSTVEYGTTPALGSSVTVAAGGRAARSARAGTCHTVAAHRAHRRARATTTGSSPTASRCRRELDLLHRPARRPPIRATSSSP